MRLLPLLILLVSLQGCMFLWGTGPHTEFAPLDAAPHAAGFGSGLVVTTGDVDEPYVEVAILTVGPRGWNSTDELVEDLREAARRADTDAVVRVDFDQYADEDGFVKRIATGTAVRFVGD